MSDPLASADPLAGDDALAPGGPSPAVDHVRSAFEALKNFAKGGVTEALKGQGVKMPDWSNKISDFAQSESVNAALGVMTPMKAGMVGAASKAVPLAKTEQAADQIALHPDAKRQLIEHLYGDAAAEREAAHHAAWAESTHRMEQESGFWLVKDPRAREAQGLPPIPPGAKSPWDVKNKPPQPPQPAPAPAQPAAARGWLRSLIEREPDK